MHIVFTVIAGCTLTHVFLLTFILKTRCASFWGLDGDHRRQGYPCLCHPLTGTKEWSKANFFAAMALIPFSCARHLLCGWRGFKLPSWYQTAGVVSQLCTLQRRITVAIGKNLVELSPRFCSHRNHCHLTQLIVKSEERKRWSGAIREPWHISLCLWLIHRICIALLALVSDTASDWDLNIVHTWRNYAGMLAISTTYLGFRFSEMGLTNNHVNMVCSVLHILWRTQETRFFSLLFDTFALFVVLIYLFSRY